MREHGYRRKIVTGAQDRCRRGVWRAGSLSLSTSMMQIQMLVHCCKIGKCQVQIGSGISRGPNSPPVNQNLGRCSQQNPNSSQAATPDILVLRQMGHANESCGRDIPASVWHPHYSSWFGLEINRHSVRHRLRVLLLQMFQFAFGLERRGGCVFTLPIVIGK